jgi:hypothetical protein
LKVALIAAAQATALARTSEQAQMRAEAAEYLAKAERIRASLETSEDTHNDDAYTI